MRRATLFSLFALAAAAPCACGLQVKGKLDTSDAGEQPIVDAGEAPEAEPDRYGDRPCVVVKDDPIDAVPDKQWVTFANAANGMYPRAEDVAGTFVGVLTKPYEPWARGAIWLREVVPFDAFDVELSYEAACSGPCADGFAIVWAATTAEPTLSDAPENGRSFGIPRGVAGGAVAVDMFRNDQTGELEAPNVNIIEMDGIREPGEYAWARTSSTGVDVRGKHRLALSLRNNQVSVRLDGAEVARARTAGTFTGYFGITGAHGAYAARFYVDDLRARFYRCDAPEP